MRGSWEIINGRGDKNHCRSENIKNVGSYNYNRGHFYRLHQMHNYRSVLKRWRRSSDEICYPCFVVQNIVKITCINHHNTIHIKN